MAAIRFQQLGVHKAPTLHHSLSLPVKTHKTAPTEVDVASCTHPLLLSDRFHVDHVVWTVIVVLDLGVSQVRFTGLVQRDNPLSLAMICVALTKSFQRFVVLVASVVLEA